MSGFTLDVKTGLESMYYAKILSDTKGAIAYENPRKLLNAQQIQVNPIIATANINSDNKTEEVTLCTGADTTVQRVMFTQEEEADLLGRVVDENGGIFGGRTDNPPYVALGYKRTLGTSGKSLYVWLYKLKFRPSNSTADTEAVDTINPQFDSYTARATIREADSQWIYSIISNDPDYGDTFFTVATLQKLSSGITPAALTLSSSVPVDDATGVSKTAPITLTFSNKILSEAVSLMEDDGTVLTVTKSFDATGKILTLTHSALTGTTTYIVAVNGVQDINGQTLEASTITFTTVA